MGLDSADEFIARWGLPTERVRAIVAETVSHASAIQEDRSDSATPLEERWYASVAAGTPDYSIYDDEAYIGEVWASWRLYSRGYLRALERRDLEPESFVDLGCGAGYTTARLVEMYPLAYALATQLPGRQADVARRVGDEYGFDVVERVECRVELVFASEYFEHFHQPIDHLRDILAIAQPRWLVVASSFSAPSAGHFPSYLVDGHEVDGRATSRAFGRELRRQGYAKRWAGWNGRPALWEYDWDAVEL